MEKWKNIPGYKGYQASNLGQIRLLLPERWILSITPIILKPSNHHGYKRLELWKDQKKKKYFVHTLVALTWFSKPSPSANLEINHIDGDRTNNRIDNLQYVTHKENMNHAIDVLKNPNLPLTKCPITIVKGNWSRHFSSIVEVASFIETKSKYIQRVLTGERSIHKGYTFKKESYNEFIGEKLKDQPLTPMQKVMIREDFVGDDY